MNRQTRIEELKSLLTEASIYHLRIYIQKSRSDERVLYRSIPFESNLKITVTSMGSAERFMDFLNKLTTMQ